MEQNAQFLHPLTGEPGTLGLRAMTLVIMVAVIGSDVKRHGKSASLMSEENLTVIPQDG